MEGQPIEGVSVRVVLIDTPRDDKALLEWLANTPKNPTTLSNQMKMAPPVGDPEWPRLAEYPRGEKRLHHSELAGFAVHPTDADGRFRIEGTGDDRMVTLRIDGPTISTTFLTTVAREMTAVNMPSLDPRFRSGKTFGCKFTYSAEPCQVIRGVVRDKVTGQPIAGVTVELSQFADSHLSIEDFLSATTNERGEYELRGIPKAREQSRGTRLAVFPLPSQPYFFSIASDWHGRTKS